MILAVKKPMRGLLMYVTFGISYVFMATHLSCSGQEQRFKFSTPENYFKKSETVRIEVFFEPGAEPFVGNRTNGQALWSVFGENLTAIFQYRTTPPDIIYPQNLDDMTAMGQQNKNLWSVQDVLNLNETFFNTRPTENEAVFYIYFLEGNAASGSNVLAFNISETPIIAVFKDAIVASGGVLTQRFVEQSTLIHEMGHAVGLVNAGVPMAQNHQDTENGAHTTNEDCVMYWLNEGASDLANFIQDYTTSNDVIMWGQEVLNDVQMFSE
ncbi:hypothetical protein MRY82_10040 [bacterium]|nr:hypothetical protein [bacterium]